MLTWRYNEPVFILMLRGRVGCLRQPTKMYGNKSIRSLASVCLSGTKLTHRHKNVLWIVQLFFHTYCCCWCQRITCPKINSTLVVFSWKKFHEICINVSKHIRIWNNGGVGDEGRKRTNTPKNFSKEEANFVPIMNALCHFSNLIIY